MHVAQGILVEADSLSDAELAARKLFDTLSASDSRDEYERKITIDPRKVANESAKSFQLRVELDKDSAEERLSKNYDWSSDNVDRIIGDQFYLENCDEPFYKRPEILSCEPSEKPGLVDVSVKLFVYKRYFWDYLTRIIDWSWFAYSDGGRPDAPNGKIHFLKNIGITKDDFEMVSGYIDENANDVSVVDIMSGKYDDYYLILGDVHV